MLTVCLFDIEILLTMAPFLLFDLVLMLTMVTFSCLILYERQQWPLLTPLLCCNICQKGHYLPPGSTSLEIHSQVSDISHQSFAQRSPRNFRDLTNNEMPPSTRKGKRAAQAADVEAKKLKKLEETNKKLMAELASTKSGCNKVKRREANMNDAMKKEIDDTISLHIWPKIKFIRDDLQKEKLAIKVWNAMADNPKKNSESDRAIFISKYATYIVQELNGKRTYKMQRMGSAVMRLLGIGPNRGAEDAEDDEDDGDGDDNNMYINDFCPPKKRC